MAIGYPKLGVNIDHVATLRQVRGTDYPNVLAAARSAERGGADFITVHLREDRRHIQDDDVTDLKNNISTHLNLELAATEEMRTIALKINPASVCIVPERREELTTEGGLNVVSKRRFLAEFCGKLIDKRINVSLFIEPNLQHIEIAAKIGVSSIELHTGPYAAAVTDNVEKELEVLKEATEFGNSLGLAVNAGHGLNYDNVGRITEIALLKELNIGHSIVCKAIDIGLESAVVLMKEKLARTAT